MGMNKEIYKASIQYKIKHMVGEVVSFTIVFALICYNMSTYKPGWLWIIESFALIVILCLCGRDYKKHKLDVRKYIDMLSNNEKGVT